MPVAGKPPARLGHWTSLSYFGNTASRDDMRYRIALHPSDEGFAVWVPGLPGCWYQGATEGEAIENTKEAIRDYLAVVGKLLSGAQVREIDVSV
jgi:predicted RNase H-like HicB family nuclease